MKIVTDAPDDARLICLKKLEQAAKQLGSDATAVYHSPNTIMDDDKQFELLARLLEKNLPREPSNTMKLYMKLGSFNLKSDTNIS